MPSSIVDIASLLGLVLAAALIGYPLLWANVRVAPHLGLIDWPKARGVAEEQIPIIGHSMVLATLLATAVMMQFYPISPWFLVTSGAMAVMGLVDDRNPLPPLDKFFFQILCITTVVYFDPYINSAMAQQYGGWGTFLAAFFILGLVNAINFIDGIDGLGGLVILLGSGAFLLLSHKNGDLKGHAVIASVIIGLMIPFLYINVIRRRGFLGNVGSYFFSYILALMHVGLPMGSDSPMSRLSVSGLCFLIPIADALMVVTTRVMTRRSPFTADRGHLHHRLVQTSMSLRYILFSFGTVELAAIAVAYLLSQTPGSRTSALPVAICVSHIAIVALLILLVEKASRRRMQSYFQRLDSGESIYFIKFQIHGSDGKILPSHKLLRLEARIGAEIRITDMCYTESPDTLFVALRSLTEPLAAISARIQVILQSENVHAVVLPEAGEYMKLREKQPIALAI